MKQIKLLSVFLVLAIGILCGAYGSLGQSFIRIDSASNSFSINGTLYPKNSCLLYISKDSLSCGIANAATGQSIFNSRSYERYILEGDTASSIEDVIYFYNSFMAGGGGGGAVATLSEVLAEGNSVNPGQEIFVEEGAINFLDASFGIFESGSELTIRAGTSFRFQGGTLWGTESLYVSADSVSEIGDEIVNITWPISSGRLALKSDILNLGIYEYTPEEPDIIQLTIPVGSGKTKCMAFKMTPGGPNIVGCSISGDNIILDFDAYLIDASPITITYLVQ